MEKTYNLVEEHLNAGTFESISFSGPRDKTKEIRNILVTKKSDSSFKIEIRFIKHNDIKDISKENFLIKFQNEYIQEFKQALLKTKTSDFQFLINKKMKIKIIENKKETKLNKTHNRSKNYLIPDGTPCDFLIEIGVMSKNGKVKSNYYKKFKQINRFLEMVDDMYKNENLESINAIDFGSGKSYLTFAIYHYFKNIKKINTTIKGIDLKQEVIDNCNLIAKKLKFSGLSFVHGFIHDFKSESDIDFVMTLHACDTATDEAILFSLKYNAKKMIFVPCCQHELNKQLRNEKSKLLLEHGVHKDKLCALITDSSRAKYLEAQGYKVQVMEFIETEHTPKNIMLRCQKVQRNDEINKRFLNDYKEFINEWSIDPYLNKHKNK